MSVFFGCVCGSGSLGEHQMSEDRKASQVMMNHCLTLHCKDDKGGDEDNRKNLCESFLVTFISDNVGV